MANLDTRVARVAESALAEQQYVTATDVLVGLGWLAQPNVDRWIAGRMPYLSGGVSVDLAKVVTALESLRTWAQGRGFQPWEAPCGDLRFTPEGNPDVEAHFFVRWATEEPPAPKAPPKRVYELTVLVPSREFDCATCGETGDLLVKAKAGGICLDCADLGHLEFLPSGDAALTRRANKASRLSAVVVRWSTNRKRYERQGILAEAEAIDQAIQLCRDDAGVRALRREHDRSRRDAVDETFRGKFTDAIRAHFPGCPPTRAEQIALHAALRGSGRVGRSAAGRALDPDAVRLAVAASVRHRDTNYDELLMSGADRDDARRRVGDRVDDILGAWRDGMTPLDT